MSRGLSNEKGFTLIEIILTIVVLGVGLYGGFALFQNASYNHIDNDFRIIGSKLASEKIEQIIADKTFSGYGSVVGANYPVENMADPYSSFTRSTTVREVSAADFSTDSAGSGYKRIDVQVAWGAADNERVIVSTVIADY